MNKIMTDKKKIIITRKSYDYTCGDGCCSEYGWTWYVDGENVHSSPCEHNALVAILDHLGFDATINFCNEEDGLDDPYMSL
jgi:hypothetical protein